MKKMQICFIVAAVAILACPTGWAKEKLTAQEWFEKGVALQQQQVFGEAVKMFTEAINLDDAFAEAYFRRGQSYWSYQKTNASEARADFSRAIDRDPKNAEIYYQRGMLNLFLLNIEATREDMETAAALGHGEAQKWLAPSRKDKEAASAPAAAAGPRDVQASMTPAAEGKAGDKEPAFFNLAEYLPSRSEPLIHFDVNIADIQEQDYTLLDEIAQVLKEKLPTAKVAVAGHTDSSGPEKYNLALSLQRARAVEAYLKENHNIAAQRLIVRGLGEGAPVATNATAEGRAKNRRVEILDARK
jgi:outer membrane protein OmpA-like peptidoglycan-associated protein